MEISDLMNRVFSFEEMASFMAKASLYPDKYVEIVAGASIPLTEKVEIFRRLSTENKYPAAAWALEQAEAALAALDTKLGDFLLVSGYWYDPKTGRDNCSTLWSCTDLEQARRAIRDCLQQEEITEDDMRWFGIEKWELNEERKYVDPYSYTLIGDEIVFFHTWDWSDYEDNDGIYLLSLIFSQSNQLNLPLPVKPGDIVQFDCMPFG